MHGWELDQDIIASLNFNLRKLVEGGAGESEDMLLVQNIPVTSVENKSNFVGLIKKSVKNLGIWCIMEIHGCQRQR